MINKTLCEHCIFKSVSKGKQVGCLLNRLDKLPHHTEGQFEIVDTFCSACRNVYWEAAQGVKSSTELAAIVYKELHIQYDVIIVIEPEDSVDDIKKTLDFCFAKSYKPTKVFTTSKLTKENEDFIRSISGRYDNRFTFMMSIEEELPLRLAPIITKSSSAYLLFVNPGNDFDDNVISDFDYSINVEMRPKILYASEKFYICPKFLYTKFMYEDNPFGKINEYVKSVTTANQCPNS